MTVESSARQQFLEEYRHIRYAEGRGSDDTAFYRALPYFDLSRRNAAMWAMRARTYRYFERRILRRFEQRTQKPLDILDLGAGNCWMSYRLSLRCHQPVALDIFNDERDGLRAARHYPNTFPLVEAEFDHLPFPDGIFDLAVYNSSLHYSTDYHRTLLEARRCIRPGGALVVLDSPVYKCRQHGERMVEERHADFLKRYGFRSDAVPSIEFLDEPTLRTLSRNLGLNWQIYRPWYGLRWHIRPYKAWLSGNRPPSRFWILVGKFQDR
ncbi:MAG: class I SAM-dependent methyltransferase [Acidobacteriaceae bacterium]|nr:class I SAM-dependent methyltransferase [Acidobacteriaceae bacterium]